MVSEPGPQLPLRIGLRDSATFDNFLVGDNQAVVHAFQSGQEPYVFAWGVSGTGKTHLLQAACHAADAQGGQSAYLPGSELQSLAPSILEGLEHLALVCLDDIQAVAGDAAWERALFDLYNRCRDAGTRILVAGTNAPGGLGVMLPDLVSRLSWGPVYQMRTLSDDQKLEALRRRACARGFSLPTEVARYLLHHASRDTKSLFLLLERMDRASLAAQRKLTIPFVRDLIRRD